ncbi:MAG TPA: hypothetical protein VMV86_01915 [Methanosarcinales archaeon]|nr:hypothetical protein [Methanosarcinales archaeon]
MRSIGAVINARMTSTRCPRKHTRKIGEKPLLDFCLEKVNKLKGLDERMLAVHDKELACFADKYENINVLWRSADAIAKGNPKFTVAFKHYCEFKSDYIMIINPCQPFVPFEVYQKAIDWFSSASFDGAVAVKEMRGFFFDEEKRPINLKPGMPLSTQLSSPLYMHAGSFSFFSKRFFIETGTLWPNVLNNPFPYEIPNKDLIDINTEEDFEVCNAIMRGRCDGE